MSVMSEFTFCDLPQDKLGLPKLYIIAGTASYVIAAVPGIRIYVFFHVSVICFIYLKYFC
jgi:hypothetical protein